MQDYDPDSLVNVTQMTDVPTVKNRSRDYYWFSPILKAALDDKMAQRILVPKNEEQLSRIVADSVQTGTPLVIRGGGTGNYGQCIPLAGGTVIDLRNFSRIAEIDNWTVRAEAGIRIGTLLAALRENGKELRLYPSTEKLSSLGGFISGGAGGVGSATWGLLAEPGNVLSVKIMTIEASPRVLTLCGDDLHKVLHAYGTTGIILDVEMPLAPAYPWIESLFSFPAMAMAIRFARDLSEQDGIVTRDIAVAQSGLPSAFKPLRPWLHEGESIVLSSNSSISDDALMSVATAHGVERRFRFDVEELSARKQPPNYEFGWNHATLNLLLGVGNVTYLQCGYDRGDEERAVAALEDALGAEVLVQQQWVRVSGKVTCFGLHIVRYSNENRLREIAAIHRKLGISVSNCHSFQCEAGELASPVHRTMATFKEEVDPHGLLNPGKLGCATIPSAEIAAQIPSTFVL